MLRTACILILLLAMVSTSAADDLLTPDEARRFINLATWADAGEIWALDFAPDDLLLAAAGGRQRDGDYTIHLLDPQTLDERGRLEGHTGQVRALRFSADGGRLLSGGFDGTARLWDVAEGLPLLELPGDPIWSAALSPDGAWIALGRGTTVGNTGRNQIEIIDATTGETVHALPLPDHIWPALTLSFSPDSAQLASGGIAADMLVWHVETGEQIADYPLVDGANVPILAAQFSPAGAGLTAAIGFVAPAGTVVRHIDLETGAAAEWIGHARLITALAYHPAGAVLLSGAEDGALLLWDAAAGAVVMRLQHGAAVRAVAFGESLAASAGADGAVRVWGVTP